MKKTSFIFLIFVSSCTIAPRVTVSNVGNNSSNSNVVVDGKIFATVYQQKAAEYRALCFQAFNIARVRLDVLPNENTGKPRAIITDIDETILDNSAYEGHQTLLGKDYESASWAEWTSMAMADTVPGAASFLKYAASKGVEIFYITNRGEKEREATLKNLKKFNLPNADNGHLMPRQNTSSKEDRRKIVSANYTVIMFLGDNLGDFSSLFDKMDMDERIQHVNSVSGSFGDTFIVLPNPVYGDWEAALYNYNYSLSPAKKDSIVKSALQTY